MCVNVGGWSARTGPTGAHRHPLMHRCRPDSNTSDHPASARAAHGDIDDAPSTVPQALPEPVVLRHIPAVIPGLVTPLAVA
jgi:hypothetical protein